MNKFIRFAALRWMYNVIVPPRYRDKLNLTEELCALESALNKVIDVTNANGKALEAISKDLEDIQFGAGGYYRPAITENEDGSVTFSFVASDDSMPPIEEKTFFFGSGGYYRPAITENEDGSVTFSFAASDDSMPPIEEKTFFLGDMQTITDMLEGFNGDPMEVKNYIDEMSGGYYTPVFEQSGNTVSVSFRASNKMLPALEGYSFALPSGPSGKSAYEVAVDNGFEGSVEDFFASLKGDNGKSAYEVYKANGGSLSVDEWLSSLKGNNGKSAYEIAVDNGFKGSVEDFFASLNGDAGKSAYEYARDGGYTGSAEDFAKQLAVEIKFDNGNLFNKAEATDGYYLASSGVLRPDSNCAVSGYIRVKPNTTYTRSSGATAYTGIEYDSSQEILNTITTKTFTTSANTFFIRVTLNTKQTPIDTYMVVEGDTLPSGYVPYGPSLRIAGQNVSLDASNSNMPLFGKLGVIGDSLSNNDKWQTIACAVANITEWHKNAITGSWLADYGNATLTPFVNRYLETPEDCDCITIMGGTNDANNQNGQNMGEVGVLSNSTFKGAYSTIIEGLLARNPMVRIILITPPRSYTMDNALNEKIKPYADATKEVAEYYGLPCLDLYNTLGINDKTFTYVLYDNVHFSEDGGARAGRLIGNFIRNNY